MIYDIHNVPPSKAQISQELDKLIKRSELFPSYFIGLSASLLLSMAIIIIILVNLSVLDGEPVWRLLITGVVVIIWLVAYFLISSLLDEKKQIINKEILANEYLDNKATNYAVFQNWCKQSPKVDLYVNAVNNQGRDLTYGEYLALKEWIIENKMVTDRKGRKSIPQNSIFRQTDTISDSDTLRFGNDAIN